MSLYPRLVAAHAAGAGLMIAVWQTAIALPPGPTDVRLLLAGLTAPVLAATASATAIAVRENNRTEQPQQQPAPVPAPRPATPTTAQTAVTR